VNKKLFGGSESDISGELDAARPLAGTGGPNAQPGAINTPPGITDPTGANTRPSANNDAIFTQILNADLDVASNTQQLLQQMKANNQYLASILNAQTQMQADTRKSTDSLEMINTKL
jgi:hypothetical protein